jgi:hypothetical protein
MDLEQGFSRPLDFDVQVNLLALFLPKPKLNIKKNTAPQVDR